MLRPFYVFSCAGFVWVVDELHPVAAVFDPVTRDLVRLVSWTEMTPGTGPRRAPRIAVDDDGFWIQYSVEDGLGRIGPQGLMSATYCCGAELICAGVDGAWLRRPASTGRDISTSPTMPPRHEPRSSIVHVDRAGDMTSVPVEGIVYSMRAEQRTLFVSVKQEPWSRVLIDYGDGRPRDRYRVEWATSTLALSLDDHRPSAVTRENHATATGPVDTSYMQDYADQTYNEAHLRKRADGTGVRWHWGSEASRDRCTIVRAIATDDGRLLWENEISDGWVLRGTAEAHRAWLLIRRTTRSGGGTRLEVWDSESQTHQHLAALDELDISEHRWPLGQQPADHESYVRYRVAQFAAPFSERVSDVHATYVGGWPDGFIELTYHHVAYPGLTIRSKVNLYDEVGRKIEGVYHWASSSLFEQAGTNHYPSASLAVNGVLDA
jgi:hypothetical protein